MFNLPWPCQNLAQIVACYKVLVLSWTDGYILLPLITLWWYKTSQRWPSTAHWAHYAHSADFPTLLRPPLVSVNDINTWFMSPDSSWLGGSGRSIVGLSTCSSSVGGGFVKHWSNDICSWSWHLRVDAPLGVKPSATWSIPCQGSGTEKLNLNRPTDCIRSELGTKLAVQTH